MQLLEIQPSSSPIEDYDRSNPAPENTAVNNFSLRTSADVYIGSFNKFTHVLVLGNLV